MTDYKTLCAELLDALESEPGVASDDWPILRARARTALADGAGVGPTDEELLELMPETMRDEFSYAAQVCSNATGDKVKPGIFRVCLNTAALEHARAVLARYGTTHPRPIPPLDATRQLILRLTAELARLHDSEPQTLDLIAEARAFIDADHPRPIPVAEGAGVGVTDEELAQTAGEAIARADSTDLVYCLHESSPDYEPLMLMFRAVLARYGTTHPRPIPVAERPWEREGFCDAEGRCWFGAPDRPGAVASWDLEREPSTDDTHWLPAAAIPLPEA